MITEIFNLLVDTNTLLFFPILADFLFVLILQARLIFYWSCISQHRTYKEPLERFFIDR